MMIKVFIHFVMLLLKEFKILQINIQNAARIA